MPELQQRDDGLGYATHPLVLGGDALIVGHDGSNQGWKTAFLAMPSEGEGIVALTNGEGGPLVDDVKCAWVEWTTGRTIPACLNLELAEDALIAGGIWLALVAAVMLRSRWVGARAVRS